MFLLGPFLFIFISFDLQGIINHLDDWVDINGHNIFDYYPIHTSDFSFSRQYFHFLEEMLKWFTMSVIHVDIWVQCFVRVRGCWDSALAELIEHLLYFNEFFLVLLCCYLLFFFNKLFKLLSFLDDCLDNSLKIYSQIPYYSSVISFYLAYFFPQVLFSRL